MEVVHSLADVTKSYQTRHGPVSSLNGVIFDISRGEMVALIGPSGAGKAALFRLLNATLRPTSGTVLLVVTVDWISDRLRARPVVA